MIEVFKTDVQTEAQSKILLLMFHEAFPSVNINFDLDDCDRVLRVQG